jgi:hypothetical protein
MGATGGIVRSILGTCTSTRRKLTKCPDNLKETAQ